MYARVTLFDMDFVRISLDEALGRFREVVLPALRQQPGYQGVYALTTPEGRGLLMTLWETQADAEAGVASGFYDEQVNQFIAVYREPPGREHYQVTFTEVLQGAG
jgi:heme-degrading monooxygenase HmoA